MKDRYEEDCGAGAEEKVPFALTDSHVAALEDAIRAEGYDILYDTETGKIRLVRKGIALDRDLQVIIPAQPGWVLLDLEQELDLNKTIAEHVSEEPVIAWVISRFQQDRRMETVSYPIIASGAYGDFYGLMYDRRGPIYTPEGTVASVIDFSRAAYEYYSNADRPAPGQPHGDVADPE